MLMVKTIKRAVIIYGPRPSTRKDKKLMIGILNKKTNRVNTIHFGQRGCNHNISKNSRKLYLTRSSGIRDKHGNLTRNNPLKANFWTRKIIWKKRK